ncbi:glycosyltransferase [Kitasatospora sp. NPDC059571]|uniref:glycosyltransferase n=1 Tax=Kitasatospora sp. NPDC059571 TaxID=3346871 RepID=UPI0036BADC2B
MARVVVISPPFRSHAVPLSVLGSALRRAGADVSLACTPAFADLADSAGLGFLELTVTRNANHGIAERTAQEDGEAARLREFLAATAEGAVAALLTQARHRRADMLAEPDRILNDLRDLDRRVRPDWYIVDQLSYPVTLALHSLALPYATFCPGHPSYIPVGSDAFFGLPYAWPDTVRPDAAALARLRDAAAANDTAFTAAFRTAIRSGAPNRPVPERAFTLCSSHAVVFNYPAFPWLPPAPIGPSVLYTGHCGSGPAAADLDPAWQAVVDRLTTRGRPLVLVALGTFLSARHDVLRIAAEGVLRHTDASVIVAAGDRVADLTRDPALSTAPTDRLHIAATVPQQALLPATAAMVHHGGNNSFTECLTAGVPALVLPFSSDQFAIAHDAERAGVGRCLDPNTLAPRSVGDTVHALLTDSRTTINALRDDVRARGPHWAAAELLRVMPDRPMSAG